jgi:hypothetical protein
MSKQPTNYDIRNITLDIVSWADEVFPERTPEGTINKLIEELKELSDNPLDAWEMADVFILLLDLCDMLGFDLAKITAHKMNVNRNRRWHIENGVFKHVKENEDIGLTESTERETLDDSSDDSPTVTGGTHVQRHSDCTRDLCVTGGK